MEALMRSMGNGAWAGLLATSAMTIGLFVIHQNKFGPLPPARLTENATPDALEPNSPDRRAHWTMLSHFGFGIVMAEMYTALNRLAKPERIPNSALRGAAFGLLVWTGSYLGWIPALGLRPSAKKLTRSQNLMMVGTHVIWGATLGYTEEVLRQRGHVMLDGQRHLRES